MKTLKEQYQSCPANEQEEFRKTIQNACDWSESTLYRKMNNPESISKLEQEKLETLFTPQ